MALFCLTALHGLYGLGLSRDSRLGRPSVFLVRISLTYSQITVRDSAHS